MKNITPSRQGLLKVQELLILLGNGKDNVGILTPINAVFNYSGLENPQISQMMIEIKEDLEKAKGCINDILSALPSQ